MPKHHPGKGARASCPCAFHGRDARAPALRRNSRQRVRGEQVRHRVKWRKFRLAVQREDRAKRSIAQVGQREREDGGGFRAGRAVGGRILSSPFRVGFGVGNPAYRVRVPVGETDFPFS